MILDVRLPGMSGVDLQRHLMLDERPPAVVFVSAHDDPDIQTNALQAGAGAFLRKPFENKALIEAIETAIRTHHGEHG
jgi:FixJ family two-component response regulator